MSEKEKKRKIFEALQDKLISHEMIIEISFESFCLEPYGIYKKVMKSSDHILNLMLLVTLQDGVIADVRISTGSVMPTPGLNFCRTDIAVYY